MESGIYKITNTINKKVYVGFTKVISDRKIQHFTLLKNNFHHNSHLQSAYNEYGIENFKFEILEKCPINILCEREHYWATVLNVHNRKYGYNIRPTDPNGSPTMAESTKEKIRIKATGRKHTEESKKKQSIAKKGKGFGFKKGHICPNRFTGRPVLQYDLEGNFVKEWKNAKRAAEHYNYKQCGPINYCAKGRVHNAYGFIWKYKIKEEFDSKIEVIFPKKSRYKNKKTLLLSLAKSSPIESQEAQNSISTQEQVESLPQEK